MSPSFMKLQFFVRIRRFLECKTTCKHTTKSSRPSAIHSKVVMVNNIEEEQEDVPGFDDHPLDDESCAAAALQRSVKKLLFGIRWEEKEMAAVEIERLASLGDGKNKKLMAELGVIPPLVGMVSSEVTSRQRAAVKALIQLANGSYTNKTLMVEAGILIKLPRTVDDLVESTRHEFAELILSLSSLGNNQFSITSSHVPSFLVAVLDSNSSSFETKESCLGTLHNLSAMLENTGPLISNGVVQTLLRLISVKQLSEKALATLGHLAVSQMGKKAMEDTPLVPDSLIEIMTWEDKPKCQELSAYILMILAHQSSAQRNKMCKAGIVPVLLELALLGSPLAQRRALKLLQWFKDERQTRIGPHSGPQTARMAMGSPVNPREAQEGKKMMKNLVKQSLYKNMEMITRRASASGETSSSKLKALVVSSSSKSLPC